MPSFTFSRALAIALTVQVAACVGDAALQGPDAGSGGGAGTGGGSAGGGVGGGGAPGGGAGVGGGAATAGGAATGGGLATGGGAATGGGSPGCRTAPLASQVKRTALAVTADPGPVHVSELPTGAAIAFAGSSAIQVRFLDASDALLPMGGFSVPGDMVLGLAASPDELGLLIKRLPDKLVVVRTSLAGVIREETTLIAGGDHTVIGVEWFDGFFCRTGRLVKTPEGYAAYSALHRRWPDNIGHQGDTLKVVIPDAGFQNYWDWGCSHSGDQRVHHNGTSLGAICQSDCYPQKAIMFNHRQTLISEEPSGNCSGGYGGELGGLTSDGDAGFALTYASKEGRGDWDVALVTLTRQGAIASRTWLTTDGGDDRTPHLARYERGLLAGWTTGSTSHVQRAPGGPVETIPHGIGEGTTDWQSWSNGDVAWLQPASTTGLELIRVRACP